jgi:hypothetical protein
MSMSFRLDTCVTHQPLASILQLQVGFGANAKTQTVESRSRFPGSAAHAPVEELVNLDTGEILWRKRRPWLALRYGDAYILVLKDLSQYERQQGQRVMRAVAEHHGTMHVQAGAGMREGLVEAHFFDVYDYLQARAALLHMSIDYDERKPVDAALVQGIGQDRRSVSAGEVSNVSNVLSVWVQCKKVTVESKFPPVMADHFWTAAFDIPSDVCADLRGGWHALAVSVSPKDGGVTAYVDGRLLATRRLPEDVQLYVDGEDARLSLSNAASCGGMSGRFKHLAVYARPLGVLEAQTMTSRLPPVPPALQDDADKAKPKSAPKGAEEEEEEEEEAEGKSAVKRYEEVVTQTVPGPQGYWPMQEQPMQAYPAGGGNARAVDLPACADRSRGLSEGIGKDLRAVGNLVYQSRAPGGVTLGDMGPTKIGGSSVLLQGGAIRSGAGALCKVANLPEAVAATQTVPELTLEMWVQRKVPLEMSNQRETLVSVDSEDKSLDGALAWFLTPSGHMDLALAGSSRTIGPCPIGAISDLQWHHLAVSRTSDPAVVNNWSFYKDGRKVWETRHEGMPLAHPNATMLLGKQHGMGWGSERGWRPGIGDKTCFQGNLAHFAFYFAALTEQRLATHHAGTAAPELAAATAAEAAAQGGADKDKEGGSGKRKGSSSSSSLVLRPAAGNSGQVVATALIAARGHSTRVWGQGGMPSAWDVNSFFSDLEKNPVFALTRRAFAPGAGIRSREVMFGTAKAKFSAYPPSALTVSGSTARTFTSEMGGQVLLSTSAAASAARSKVEAAHAAAAAALRAAADPGGVGLWMRATAHVLCSLPRHYMYSRQWQELAATLGNLCFLVRLVAARGLEEAIATCSAGLDAITDTNDESDMAREAAKR